MSDKLRILVVDDNVDVRLLTTTWLKGSYLVDSAIDGNDCLVKIKKNVYDLIFLDVMMPGPKPQELLNSITKVLPNVMIIYMTAVEMFNPTPDQERQGFMPVITPAVKGYITKPIDKNQLLNKINEVISMERLLAKKPSKKKSIVKLKKLTSKKK